MSLKKNLVANYLGTGWSALMSIVFVPFYLHFIGAEGYGLVGFFMMLSASLSVLDVGLAAVATREASAYVGSDSGQRSDIAKLLRTIEIAFLGISLIIGVVVSLLSPFIVRHWLNVPVELIHDTTWALFWMGSSIAIQFFTTFYSGSLIGFQRQVGLNVINVVGATIRGGGAILVLWLISPTIQAFFAWQAVGAMGMLIAQRKLFVRGLEETPSRFEFSLQSLKRVRHFAAGMGVINVLALVLTQLDKIVLSSVLPLKYFGYYSLGWTLGTLIYRLTGPIFNAYYPRITQLVVEKNNGAMLDTYQQACRVMAVAVVPISLWLAIFSHDILLIWTRDSELANNASGALSVIALGTMFNAYMHMPYALQLAHSYTRLTLVQNVIAAILLAPLTWFLATHYSLTFAALPWLLVNFGYVVIGAPLMHRHLNIPGLKDWYVRAVLKPAIYSGCGMLSTKIVWGLLVGYKFTIILLSICLATGLTVALLSSRLIGIKTIRQLKETL